MKSSFLAQAAAPAAPAAQPVAAVPAAQPVAAPALLPKTAGEDYGWAIAVMAALFVVAGGLVVRRRMK